MATGHLLIGGTMYIALKIVGVSLIPVIFDITREKLMTLPWFVFLYEQFERVHAMAMRFVAPYRVAALDFLRRARDTAWATLGAILRGNRRRGLTACLPIRPLLFAGPAEVMPDN